MPSNRNNRNSFVCCRHNNITQVISGYTLGELGLAEAVSRLYRLKHSVDELSCGLRVVKF